MLHWDCCLPNGVYNPWALSHCSPHAYYIAVLQPELSSGALRLISGQGFPNLSLVLEKEHFGVTSLCITL